MPIPATHRGTTMAKKAKDTTDMNDSTPTVTVAAQTGTDDCTLTYDKWSVTARELGWPAGVALDKRLAYLLTVGFTGSMTDAAAFTKDQKAIWEGKGKDRVKVRDLSEDEIEAKAAEKRAARFDAIRAGTVAHRSFGPRLAGIDRVMQDVAKEQVLAAIAALNAKARATGTPERATPKGDALTGYVEKWLAKHGDAVRVEAQARIDAAAKMAESTDEDIFAD